LVAAKVLPHREQRKRRSLREWTRKLPGPTFPLCKQ
jgi:hypothetical protein